MQCEKDDGRSPHQPSSSKKVLAGEAVHLYYYLAVLLYLVSKAKDQQMIEDFFTDLKNLFIKWRNVDQPPPAPGRNPDQTWPV